MAKVIDSKEKFNEKIKSIQNKYDNWVPDKDQYKKMDMINWEHDKVVLFFGKYLYTKGLQLIIASAPLILLKHPETKFIFVGFGRSREVFESIAYALEINNRDLFESLLKLITSEELVGSANKVIDGVNDKIKCTKNERMKCTTNLTQI